MRVLKRMKRIAGFTLQELLLVVAIIGVLSAVAIPSVISYRRSLKLTQLDDNARAVFMAAQNRMVAMEHAGELPRLNTVATKIQLAVHNGDDAEGSGAAESKLDLAYLSSGNASHAAALDSLLPPGSIEAELRDGFFVVEYSPDTGSVYAVFYAEKAFDDDYAQLSAQRDALSEKGYHDYRLKHSPQVGYFGGSYVERPDVGQMPIPQVTLINAEELLLRLRFTGESEKLLDGNSFVDVSVNGKTILSHTNLDIGFIGTVALDTLNNYGKSVTSAAAIGKDWKVGVAFKDWETGVEPGKDIEISVKLYYEGSLRGGTGEASLLPQVVTVTANSLFAGLTDDLDGDGTPDMPEGEYAAEIAYGRHLQNLSRNDFNETPGFNSGVGEFVTAARQINAIDFGATYQPGSTDDAAYYWAETYGDMQFISIENHYLGACYGQGLLIRDLNATGARGGLFNAVGTNGSTTLKDIVLVNAKAGTTGVHAGTLVGETFNTVVIDGCQVYLEPNSDGTYLGDVHVSATNAGGLVGAVNDFAKCQLTIKNSFASTVVRGSACAGGLVGKVQGGSLTVENSYAAGFLTSDELAGFAGGLVGVDRHTTGGGTSYGSVAIKNSYAAGTVAQAKTAAGLCVSYDDSASVTNSYAAVRYGDKIETIYGLINEGTVDGSVYLTMDGKAQGKGEALSSAEDLEAWARSGHGNWYNGGGSSPTYAALTYNLNDANGNGEADFLRLNAPYPYPMLLCGRENSTPMLIHYGDWLAEVSVTYLVYYEKYDKAMVDNYGMSANLVLARDKDNKDYYYGFYAITHDDIGYSVLLNTLLSYDPAQKPNQHVYAVADGYALFSASKQSKLNYELKYELKPAGGTTSITSGSLSAEELQDAQLVIPHVVTDTRLSQFRDFYVYLLPGMDTVPVNGGYYKMLVVNNKTFWCNPNYAAEAVNEDNMEGYDVILNKLELVTDVDRAIVIRSARQLANMATLTADYPSEQARKYQQKLDIDYAKYTGPLKMGKSAGAPQTPAKLSGTGAYYYGNRYTIRNLYITATANTSYDNTYAGLFGEVSGGTLDGIRLVNISVDVSNAKRVGGLVGYLNNAGGKNKNVVSDCGIYVASAADYDKFVIKNKHTLTDTTPNDFVGGLIGTTTADAEIKNSFAAVQVTGARRAGGFSGNLNGVKVTDCYSAGHTVNGAYTTTPNVSTTGKGASGNEGTWCGGFTAEFEGENLTLNGTCYTTCSVGMASTNIKSSMGLFAGRLSDKLYAQTAENKADYESPLWNNSKASNAKLYAVGEVVSGTATVANETGYGVKSGVSNAPTGSKVTAYPYDLGKLSGSSYPYATALTEHHGDWKAKKTYGNAELIICTIEWGTYYDNAGNGYDMFWMFPKAWTGGDIGSDFENTAMPPQYTGRNTSVNGEMIVLAGEGVVVEKVYYEAWNRREEASSSVERNYGNKEYMDGYTPYYYGGWESDEITVLYRVNGVQKETTFNLRTGEWTTNYNDTLGGQYVIYAVYTPYNEDYNYCAVPRYRVGVTEEEEPYFSLPSGKAGFNFRGYAIAAKTGTEIVSLTNQWYTNANSESWMLSNSSSFMQEYGYKTYSNFGNLMTVTCTHEGEKYVANFDLGQDGSRVTTNSKNEGVGEEVTGTGGTQLPDGLELLVFGEQGGSIIPYALVGDMGWAYTGSWQQTWPNDIYIMYNEATTSIIDVKNPNDHSMSVSTPGTFSNIHYAAGYTVKKYSDTWGGREFVVTYKYLQNTYTATVSLDNASLSVR